MYDYITRLFRCWLLGWMCLGGAVQTLATGMYIENHGSCTIYVQWYAPANGTIIWSQTIAPGASSAPYCTTVESSMKARAWNNPPTVMQQEWIENSTAYVTNYYTGNCSGPAPPNYYFKKCWTNADASGNYVLFALYNPTSGERSNGQVVPPGETACITITTTNKTGWKTVRYDCGGTPDCVYSQDHDTNGNPRVWWDADWDRTIDTIPNNDPNWSSNPSPPTSGNLTNTTPISPGGTLTPPTIITDTRQGTGGGSTEGSMKAGFDAVVETLRANAQTASKQHQEDVNRFNQFGEGLERKLDWIGGDLDTIANNTAFLNTNGVPNITNLLGQIRDGVISNATWGVMSSNIGVLAARDGSGSTITNYNDAIAGIGQGTDTNATGFASNGSFQAPSSTGSGSDPGNSWTFTILGTTIDFNPMHYDYMADLATWFRFLLKWGLVSGLAIFVARRTQDAINAMGGWHQTTGSMVSVAGFGTNLATAIVARLLIIAILDLVPAFYIAWKSNQSSLFAALGVDPFSTANPSIAQGLWLANQFLPLDVMVSDAVLALSFTVALTAVCYGKQIMVRSVPG